MHTRNFFAHVAAVFLASASFASAQFGQNQYNTAPSQAAPYSPRPALSPFLNLLRGGDPAANYYLGVLPEYNNRYFQRTHPLTLQEPARSSDMYLDDRADLEVQIRQLPPTGHAAGFMIYNAYFNVPHSRGFIPYNPGMGRANPALPR